MTHVLIVDDEVLERQAMKKILSKAFPGIKKLGEASSGSEAVTYAKDHSPELVLMDIKMPGMDGLEAIQEIKKFNDQIRFIMVSAFDTFEYAQKAIRAGVKDYLLKPSKKEEIIQTISKVLQDMENEKAKQELEHDIQIKYNRAISQLESDWVANLLLNYINRESFYLESFSVDDYQQFLALVVTTSPINEQDELAAESQNALYNKIEEIIDSICSAAIGPVMGFHIPVLLPFNEEEQETSIQSRATHTARQILKELEKNIPYARFRIGIGPPVEDVYEFSVSYQKALLALEETSENVRYLYYHPSILMTRSETKLDDFERSLIEIIRAGNVKAFEQVFQDYFKELGTNFEHSLIKMIEHLEELRIVLNRYLKDVQSELILPEQAFQAETVVQLRERARSSLVTLNQHIHNWQTEKAGGVIYQAKDWIDQHYCEEVTLDEVAAKVQLSPFYFSKLFKENLGQTFIDYLTQKRIKLAKDLLINTEKTFKEICFEVGYHDPNYFSRVFKKITGLTPSEFKKMA